MCVFTASGKDKSVGRVKMMKDPLYLQFIDQVVAEVRIEGGYRKPEWSEFLILQLVYMPMNLYHFAVKYHRRYISKEVSDPAVPGGTTVCVVDTLHFNHFMC